MQKQQQLSRKGKIHLQLVLTITQHLKQSRTRKSNPQVRPEITTTLQNRPEASNTLLNHQEPYKPATTMQK